MSEIVLPEDGKDVMDHFRIAEDLDEWINKIFENNENKSIAKQLQDIIKYGHDLHLDWYITYDRESIRCGRRDICAERARNRLVRIVPRLNPPGAEAIWRTDDEWTIEYRQRIDLPLNDENLNNLKGSLRKLALHHAHEAGSEREGYWPDDYVSPNSECQFEMQVQQSLQKTEQQRLRDLETANIYPARMRVTTSVFQRNPDVVATVLIRANGICESCRTKAPFLRRSNGQPYLEVHHKVQLASGGPDSVENAIALCPNCHRDQHFGQSPPQI